MSNLGDCSQSGVHQDNPAWEQNTSGDDQKNEGKSQYLTEERFVSIVSIYLQTLVA